MLDKSEWLQRVRDELELRKGTWPDICQGSGVKYTTLQKIALGSIKDPGTLTTERLYKYLFKGEQDEQKTNRT